MLRSLAARAPEPPLPLAVQEAKLATALSERYLAYALSTITARSLPDVRDGLKPVHRRLLFAMRALGLKPAQMPKKSARVVGDVIGKFHPHGDTAVYEALVRLAQDFAQRYPLVEGQGNFGNIDGDNPAAMRYTEAKLTDVAELLLDGLDEDSVAFRPTYDGSGDEPLVLPSAFPNLLANGASGIAVGMATSIPPHNIAELCDALRLLIQRPDASITDLLRLLPAPDFPTGGVLIEPPDSIHEAYTTGRGGFRLRAAWIKEELRQGAWQIIVTEMPYQVPKARLIAQIADLLMARKIPLLDDIRDESTDDVRLVLVPKSRNVDPAVLMESLFRQSELEVRFPLNLNVLDKDGVPRVMNLREALQAWLDHRQDVLLRCSRHRLGMIESRLEILSGLRIAYLNLDEVIRIIRTEDEPKPVLMQTFSLTDTQTEAILNMRLRSLRKLEEMEIKREQKTLAQEQAELKRLLSSEAARWQRVDADIAALRESMGPTTRLGARRTLLAAAPSVALVDMPPEATAPREDVTVLCSAKGWIRALRGHGLDLTQVKHKEGDEGLFALETTTLDKALLFASNGRFYTLNVDKLPGGRGFGEPVRLLVDLPNEADILTLLPYQPGQKFLLASRQGRGFVVKAEDILAQTKAGKQVLVVDAPDRAAALALVQGDHVGVIGTNRKILLFPLDQVPEMVKGRGVILQRYKDGELSDVMTLKLAEGLQWQSGERVRTEPDARPWLGDRAQSGRLAPSGFTRSNRFSS